MNGNRVYAFAKGAMAESCLRVLDPDGTANKKELCALLNHVDRIIPHQANARIIKAAAEYLESKLELPEGAVKNKMIVTIDKYGNNSTASIPLALDESLQREAPDGGPCDSRRLWRWLNVWRQSGQAVALRPQIPLFPGKSKPFKFLM